MMTADDIYALRQRLQSLSIYDASLPQQAYSGRRIRVLTSNGQFCEADVGCYDADTGMHYVIFYGYNQYGERYTPMYVCRRVDASLGMSVHVHVHVHVHVYMLLYVHIHIVYFSFSICFCMCMCIPMVVCGCCGCYCTYTVVVALLTMVTVYVAAGVCVDDLQAVSLWGH